MDPGRSPGAHSVSMIEQDTDHLVELPKQRPVPAYEGPAVRKAPVRARRVTLSDRLVAAAAVDQVGVDPDDLLQSLDQLRG